jgi:FkbM family methyltransferase
LTYYCGVPQIPDRWRRCDCIDVAQEDVVGALEGSRACDVDPCEGLFLALVAPLLPVLVWGMDKVKQFIQDSIGRFGYELHRKRPAFQPYVQQISLAGVTFRFWVGNAIGKEWYDPDVNSRLAEHTETARLVAPGDRVLEIGAHHGFTAMLLSKLVGERGSVLAVEPSPFNAMMATAQVGLNRAGNCQVLLAAASDRKGIAKLSRDLVNEQVTEAADGVEVSTITADELDSTFGPFNVLKVDVQGFEYQVLKGAEGLLRRQPKLLLELHGPQITAYGSTAPDVLSLLNPSYKGTFVMWPERDRVHAFPAEKFGADDIVNLFLALT